MMDFNLVSFSLFDTLTININRKAENGTPIKIEPILSEKEEEPHMEEMHELSLNELHDKITESSEAIVYLIVEKNPSTSWNLIMPVVYNTQTNHWTVFTRNCSLQGCGGGLNNTTSILYNVRKAKRSGYNVGISARVCDNDKMKKLRTMQIGIKDLLDSSFPLENYATNQFKEINQTYREKTIEYK